MKLVKIATPGWLQGIWKFLALLIIVVVIISVYLHYQYKYPSTNDANVRANVTAIASQVSGIVATVNVKNDQYVKQDQLLFSLDPTSYQLAVDKAQANLQLVMQNLTASQDEISSAIAKLESLKLAEQRLANQYKRYDHLRKAKVIAGSDFDNIQTQWHEAQQAVNAQLNTIASLRHKNSLTVGNTAALRVAQAALAQAKLDLIHTQVSAPASGYVTNLLLTKGAPVTAYQLQFSIIDMDHAWVTANYLEFELDRIRPGQTANIHLLMYPHHTFQGVVESIGYGIKNGSGTTADILPDVDPSLNWIRLAQRFPVRIKILNPNVKFPLRVGANARVTIDTTKMA